MLLLCVHTHDGTTYMKPPTISEPPHFRGGNKISANFFIWQRFSHRFVEYTVFAVQKLLWNPVAM